MLSDIAKCKTEKQISNNPLQTKVTWEHCSNILIHDEANHPTKQPLWTFVIGGCHSPKSKPQWTLMKAHMFVVLCYVTIRAGDGGRESSLLGRKLDFPLTQPLSPTSSLSNFKDSIWSWMTLLHNLWNEVCKDLLKYTDIIISKKIISGTSSTRRIIRGWPLAVNCLPISSISDHGVPPWHKNDMIFMKSFKIWQNIIHFGVFPEWVDGDIEETMFPNLCSGGRTLYGHYSHNNHIIFS